MLFRSQIRKSDHTVYGGFESDVPWTSFTELGASIIIITWEKDINEQYHRVSDVTVM